MYLCVSHGTSFFNFNKFGETDQNQNINECQLQQTEINILYPEKKKKLFLNHLLSLFNELGFSKSDIYP